MKCCDRTWQERCYNIIDTVDMPRDLAFATPVKQTEINPPHVRDICVHWCHAIMLE